MMLSLFSTLPIGRIPAYQIAKAQKTHRYQDVTLRQLLFLTRKVGSEVGDRFLAPERPGALCKVSTHSRMTGIG
jgi:hypothetical protein